ncbi:hypothetical protein GCM10010343_37550 [Streptomyces avidinii]|nr:hypothetical protein GCM10010343_37550 [Streptomyces avidinii]
MHDLTTYERVVGPGELKQPDGHGAGAVGVYRVEDCDAGRVGGSRGVSRGHGLVQPLHRTGRWAPFAAENAVMRLIMSRAETAGPRHLSSDAVPRPLPPGLLSPAVDCTLFREATEAGLTLTTPRLRTQSTVRSAP